MLPSILKVVILLAVYNEVNGAKILVAVPTPSVSHQAAMRPLTLALVKRGHEVVVITTDPAFPPGKAPKNLTEIDVHDVSYAHFEEVVKKHDGNKANVLMQFVNMLKKFTTTFEKQIQTPEVQKLLNEEADTFDLIITEGIIRTATGLGHKLKKPIILCSSFGLPSFFYHLFGAPAHPIVYPNIFNQRLYNLTWTEKLAEYAKQALIVLLIAIVDGHDHEVAKRNFGEDIPSFDDLYEQYVHMLFINEHPIWASNRPVPPNVLHIGGMVPPKNVDLNTLPKDILEYLNSSKNGVVYVSFGTNVRTALLPPEKVEIMIKVLSKLPYDILWKWDQDEMPGKSKNIKISKWLPQAQLLHHPNVKLFITQGGLQSTDEAIIAEVPVIGIPMLGDQWYNTEKYAHHKIGLQLDINTLTDDIFREAVTDVLTDNSYRENIARLRIYMQEAPIDPVDAAVWWTEYVIKHGGKHLRSPAYSMSVFKYYEIPLIITLLLILTSGFVGVVLLIRYVISLVFASKKKVKIS